MTATQQRTEPITRDDIKAKLLEIQGDATDTVHSAKNQLIAVGVAVATVVVVAAFLIGRRGGRRRSTIIELKRA
ncbi:MAG TPA: hypothetical protein VJM33_06040 [Microthrixaceae bacterium]|nr:hypothetical protein [Microthrixaceae bacterium]